MLTESEARVKECPIKGQNCVASACMFWGWFPITNPHNGAQRFITADNPTAVKEEDAGTRPPEADEWQFVPFNEESPAGWVEPAEDALQRRKGWCILKDTLEVFTRVLEKM